MQQGDLSQDPAHVEFTKEHPKHHHFSLQIQGIFFDLVISSVSTYNSTCQDLCIKIQKHNTPLHTLLPPGREWANKHMPDGSRIAQCTTGRHSVIAETNTTYSKSRKCVQSSHFLVLCVCMLLSTMESWSITRSTRAIKQKTVTFPRFYMGGCRGRKVDQKQGL